MTRSLAANSKSWPAAGISAQVRLIAFAVTALAVFAAELYFWPPPIRGYVVEATLDAQVEDQAVKVAAVFVRPQQTIRDVVLSRETVRAALTQVGPPPGAKRGAVGAFPTEAEVAFVVRRLYVESPPDRGAVATRLTVGYNSQESDWGRSFLDHLVRQAVSGLDERAAEEISARQSAKAESPLALAMRREEAALAALDGFLNRHFDQLNHPGVSHQGAKQQEPTPANPPLNPKWQNLQERLSAEMARLEQLLLDRLPDHPQAKESQARIEEIKRQLGETSKYLNDEPHATESRSAARHSGNEAVQSAQFSQEVRASAPGFGGDSAASAGDEYERRLAELTEAREARRLAERERALRLHSESVQTPAPIVRGTIVADARLAQTLREAPSTGRLTVLALSSIFAGACLAAMLRIPRTSRVYSSAADVEADLALPVVAVVPSATKSAIALSR